ncbi:hypothetical protein LguiA_012870 [Lonicera macranthoides]
MNCVVGCKTLPLSWSKWMVVKVGGTLSPSGLGESTSVVAGCAFWDCVDKWMAGRDGWSMMAHHSLETDLS